MARKKLSEYRSKQILNSLFGISYVGWEVTTDSDVNNIDGYKSYVLKVDQAVKGRYKKGLVSLDISKSDITAKMSVMRDQGYEHFIVEPFIEHSSKEYYLSMKRERTGIVLTVSDKGGIDIEDNQASIVSGIFEEVDPNLLEKTTGLTMAQLHMLHNEFSRIHATLIEINPYIIFDKSIKILDAAIEIDSVAELLTDAWSSDDIRSTKKEYINEERVVQKLNDDSPSSFSLEVINPNGEIFLLLSGGGASIVVADEIHDAGLSDVLGNYGEYSGNPTEHETFNYTQQVVKLLLKSSSKRKVLFIGGAVANFTDIPTTFKGIISAIREESTALKNQNVRVYVRRGGPRQEMGLELLTNALEELDLLGGVYGPSVSISEAVTHMIKGLKS